MVKPVKGSFFRSPTDQGGASNNVDYISSVNDLIKTGQNVDIESALFKNAVSQFNAGLKKGSVKRLEIPEGFCGYIDPASGELRVQPDPNTNYLKPGKPVPQTLDKNLKPGGLENIPYKIDPCLEKGLPGSIRYRECKSDQTGEGSGIDWAQFMPQEPTLESLAAASDCTPGDGKERRWSWGGNANNKHPGGWDGAFKEANDWVASMEKNCPGFKLVWGPDNYETGGAFESSRKYVRVMFNVSPPTTGTAGS